MSEANGSVKARMVASCTRRRGQEHLEELGLTVHYQNLTERERAEIEQSIVASGPDKRDQLIRAMVICKCQTDSEGNRLWGDHELSLIGDMDSAITSLVYDAIDRFCMNITLDDAIKNSESVLTASSL